MRSCVYITDPSWLATLEKTGVRNNVNFWRKDRRRLDLLPGDVFYFKLKGSAAIAGRGYFRQQIQLTIDQAWIQFGKGNGAASLLELRHKAKRTLGLADENINCLVLDCLEFLPETSDRPLLDSRDFPTGIMNCKFFEGNSLNVVEQYFSAFEDMPALIGAEVQAGAAGFDPEFISTARELVLRSICARRGQGRFRRGLLDAYDGRCCVTGETVSTVLEAAHIHPYLGDDTDKLTNGLLLRSDWHTLFDLGLWTLDKTFAVILSRELDASTYARHNGSTISVPTARAAQPSQAALKYHREKIFRP